MQSSERGARARVTAKVWAMEKLDVPELERAAAMR
jgi:hypothetical protein